jgi:hypothetical protein
MRRRFIDQLWDLSCAISWFYEDGAFLRCVKVRTVYLYALNPPLAPLAMTILFFLAFKANLIFEIIFSTYKTIF